jgi:hypothetical protein
VKRTTIFVPEALERDLQLYARRAGKPTAAVVREALASYIAQKSFPDRLPSFAAAFDSGRPDTAERHEDLLFKHVSPHGDGEPVRHPRRRASARMRASPRTRAAKRR